MQCCECKEPILGSPYKDSEACYCPRCWEDKIRREGTTALDRDTEHRRQELRKNTRTANRRLWR